MQADLQNKMNVNLVAKQKRIYRHIYYMCKFDSVRKNNTYKKDQKPNQKKKIEIFQLTTKLFKMFSLKPNQPRSNELFCHILRLLWFILISWLWIPMVNLNALYNRRDVCGRK